MCCGATDTFDLPAEVIEALARYEQLRTERPFDWGDDRIEFFRWGQFLRLQSVFELFVESGDLVAAVRTALRQEVPAGVVFVRVDGPDRELIAQCGPPVIAFAGQPVTIDVIVDVEPTTTQRFEVDPDHPSFTFAYDGRTVDVDVEIRTVPSGELRLTSPRCARWSVTDADGIAWFPDGALAKWNANNEPFFHGHDLTVTVPAGVVNIVCARGLEFDRVMTSVEVAAGQTKTVDCDPPRLYDPAADGWFGGDLHVHMNYSGDQICTPEQAARMQTGEGLHLMNLVAGNCQTSLVYDREQFEHYAGGTLPWSSEGLVASPGVEYRNDLLGHVHALGPTGAPTRYFTGHDRSDHPEDWPPNATACAELRELGATIGYCHPAGAPFPEDWSTDRFFAVPRSVEARELVADAALGLVDSIDLLSPFDNDGAVFLYHRLLSCGIRLAATAGTDTFLSFSRLGVAANPPGYGRVYADLQGQPLSVAAFQDAIRAGRTIVTNGPWLSFSVSGSGPGSILDVETGAQLAVSATVVGPGVDTLAIVGPDGVLAEVADGNRLEVEVVADRPTWIAAVARGGRHPHTLDQSVLAHSSPVYVDMDGRRVARAADGQWCLDFLDSFQQLADRHGHFDPATRKEHFGDLVAVIDRARDEFRRVAASKR